LRQSQLDASRLHRRPQNRLLGFEGAAYRPDLRRLATQERMQNMPEGLRESRVVSAIPSHRFPKPTVRAPKKLNQPCRPDTSRVVNANRIGREIVPRYNANGELGEPRRKNVRCLIGLL
jgi:hypothetical protein